jgi:hypothetical protein
MKHQEGGSIILYGKVLSDFSILIMREVYFSEDGHVKIISTFKAASFWWYWGLN